MYLTKYRNLVPSSFRTNSGFFDEFKDFFGPSWEGGSMLPASNVKETSDNFQIEIAAPGFEKADFKINLENDVLTIASEKKVESAKENEHYTRKEFQYSTFSRSWNLPESVDVSSINASYDKGILSVVLPKKQESTKQTNKVIEIA